jgi:sphinganine-1-phosphate aldolase
MISARVTYDGGHSSHRYIETTRQIVGATREIAARIEEIEGIELTGRADACVVAFTGAEGSGINCYSLCDAMKEINGWDLATLQSPPAVHLALTLPTARNAAGFCDDLKAAIALLRSEPEKYSGGTAGLYGSASKLPASFVQESAKVYLDTMSKCKAE